LLLVLILWGGFYITQVLHNPSGEKIGSYLLTKSLFGSVASIFTGYVGGMDFPEGESIANFQRLIGCVYWVL
jgi:hypothetical protein